MTKKDTWKLWSIYLEEYESRWVRPKKGWIDLEVHSGNDDIDLAWNNCMNGPYILNREAFLDSVNHVKNSYRAKRFVLLMSETESGYVKQEIRVQRRGKYVYWKHPTEYIQLKFEFDEYINAYEKRKIVEKYRAAFISKIISAIIFLIMLPGLLLILLREKIQRKIKIKNGILAMRVVWVFALREVDAEWKKFVKEAKEEWNKPV
jgi:hypothetical protein